MPTKNLFGEFITDPFLRHSAITKDDLDTMVLLDTHHMIEFNIKFNLRRAFQILLKGQRGIGKTLAIFYARELIKEKNDPKVLVYDTTGLDVGFSSLEALLQRIGKLMNSQPTEEEMHKIHVDLMGKTFYEIGSIIDKFLGDYHVILLVDIPDLESVGKHFDKTAEILEQFFYSEKTSIIMAVNPDQSEKFENVSTILGKFNPINLLPLNIEETKEMIASRMFKYRTNNLKNKKEIKPFTEKAITIIHKISGGNPRNILNSCQKIFSTACTDNKMLIDEYFTEKTLQKKYVEAILEDRIKDDTQREQLYKLYSFIKGKCNGEVIGVSSLQKKMMNAFSWNDFTARKKLEELKKCNIIKIQRDEKKMNTKIVKVVV
jgi:DNA polymerase III delta prime subunit